MDDLKTPKILKPTAYMLIGPPGCGKSTWAHKHAHLWHTHASSDKYIDLIASKEGKSYGEVFKTAIDPATKMFNIELHDAIETRRNIVIDRTNTAPKARRQILADLKEAGYTTVAVVFDVSAEVCLARQDKRVGKPIPRNVFDSMMKTHVDNNIPSAKLHSEFDQVITVRD